MKIVATVTVCEQVGMNAWRDRNNSRVFNSSASIDDILHWAKTIIGKDIELTDVLFSTCADESV